MATVLGWGILPNKEYADYLQVGYALIKPFDEHTFDGEGNYIYHRQIGGSSQTCPVTIKLLFILFNFLVICLSFAKKFYEKF